MWYLLFETSMYTLQSRHDRQMLDYYWIYVKEGSCHRTCVFHLSGSK